MKHQTPVQPSSNRVKLCPEKKTQKTKKNANSQLLLGCVVKCVCAVGAPANHANDIYRRDTRLRLRAKNKMPANLLRNKRVRSEGPHPGCCTPHEATERCHGHQTTFCKALQAQYLLTHTRVSQSSVAGILKEPVQKGLSSSLVYIQLAPGTDIQATQQHWSRLQQKYPLWAGCKGSRQGYPNNSVQCVLLLTANTM